MKLKNVNHAAACLWLGILIAAGHLGAAEYYVDRDSLGGACDDSNTGRETDPWCTLDKANTTVQPGDTVFVRQGTYDERIVPSLSGEEGRPIVYRAYGGENAVISGQWGHSATLDGIDHVTIDGLTFDGGLNTATGIYIDNHGDHITIRGCTIRNFRNPENTGGMGIWVARGGASHLLIEDCTIFNNGTDNPDLQNGSNIHIFSESDNITVRGCDIYESATEDGLHLGAFGLVTDVVVENCRFWGNKEDGIDMKLVERVTVRGCEFWGHSETSTGGGAGIVIHMGARDVLVDQCISHDNDDGFAIAYNNDGTARSTERITIRRSVMYGNGDFAVHVAGGYWGGPMEGMLGEIYFYNNTIYENGYGVFLYAHPDGDVRTVELFNNILWGNRDYDFGVHSDRIEMLTTDYNDYPGGESGAVINWHGSALTLSEFQSASGQEAASLAVDPGFNDAAAQDFTLTETSPVIDRGTDVGLAFNGAAPDMGAYEYGVPVEPDEDVPDGLDPDPLPEEAAPEPADGFEPQDASTDAEPPPDAGSDAEPQEPGSEGCGCRMASSTERLPSPLPLLLLLSNLKTSGRASRQPWSVTPRTPGALLIKLPRK